MSTLTDSKELLDIFQNIQREMELKYGPFMIFALFKPIGSQRFDLFISATWSDVDFTPIVKEMTSILSHQITLILKIGSVIVMNTSSEIAKTIMRNYPTQGEVIRIRNEEFDNLEVSEGWILKAG